MEIWKKLREILSNIWSTVDDVFEYMEKTAKSITSNIKSLKEKLREIYKFADSPFQHEKFAFMKIIVEYIDVAEDPYPTERKHIIESLKIVQDNEPKVIELVEEARKIWNSILDEEVLDNKNARRFDEAAKRANEAIESCKKNLKSIEPVLEDLLRKTNTIKWFSRCIRVFCMGITWSYLYGKYIGSNIPMPVALGGGVLSGLMWLSLFPSRSYELFDSLRELKDSSERLYIKLEELNDQMNGDVDAKKKHFKDQKD